LCDNVVDNLNDVFSSDGEEFSDDVILQDLRRRRSTFLTMLLQLDETLLSRSWWLRHLDHQPISYHCSSFCCCCMLLLFLLGQPLQKSIRLCHFRSDRDEIWEDYSSSQYASTDW